MNILVKRTGAMGDVLETSPIIARLHEENPDARIDVETQYGMIFDGNPHISAIGRTQEHYDRTIDLNMAFENALRKIHPIDAYSEVAFGDRNTPHRLELSWKPASSYLRNLLGDRGVVIHPARSWPIRTLPLEWWQLLVDILNDRDYRVIVTGTAQDHGGLFGVTDFRGRLTLAEQAGLIDAAACFVCSESGPMIVAQTTQTPIIALLTMVPPEHIKHADCNLTAVRAAVPCVGCASDHPAPTTFFGCKLGHSKCLTAFDARAVANLVDELT
jgi:ADP-heptose:LPS heptosyltransferase